VVVCNVGRDDCATAFFILARVAPLVCATEAQGRAAAHQNTFEARETKSGTCVAERAAMNTSLLRGATVLGFLFGSFLALAGCSGSAASIPGSPDDGSGSRNGSGTGTSNGSGSGGGGARSGAGSTTVSAEGAALFDSPSSTDATADSIYGLWGGVMKDLDFTFDTRMRLTPDSITFATRCDHDGTSGAIAGVTAKARVNAEEVAVLESKKDERKLGDLTCRANAHPGNTKRCANSTDNGFQTQCFILNGTELTFYGDSPFDKLSLIKISD